MNTTFMPFVKKDGPKKGVDPVEAREALLRIIISAGWQQRQEIVIHPLLVRAAMKRAMSMATRGYFGHTDPDGVTPNEVARSVGYKLPDWYSPKGNNIESIYIGSDEPEDVVNTWFASPKHHDHLVGDGFYQSQNAIGIGSSTAQDGRAIWVFLSAPNMG